MSDIARLFSQDPLSLTKEDVASIVAEMRNSLHLFNAKPAATRTKAAPKVSAEVQAISEKLSLDDLGI